MNTAMNTTMNTAMNTTRSVVLTKRVRTQRHNFHIRVSVIARSHHTSTPAFQICPIQKEALEFCEFARINHPVHFDYDRGHKALFIQTYDQAHYVVDLEHMMMSCARPNTHGVKTHYHEIAITKCIRKAEDHFYDIIEEFRIVTRGQGSLEFSRDMLTRALNVAMRFSSSPEPLAVHALDVHGPSPPPAQFIKVDANTTHCEYDLNDDLSLRMCTLAKSPLRPSSRKVVKHEVHDW